MMTNVAVIPWDETLLGQARLNWRDGHRYLEVTAEIDDESAVAAATRNSAVF